MFKFCPVCREDAKLYSSGVVKCVRCSWQSNMNITTIEPKKIVGRPASVSKKISDTEYTSQVKRASVHGGAYIPVPKCLIGQNVKIILLGVETCEHHIHKR